MTPERLERLLRSGACMYARPDGHWDLYRSPDRRRRPIRILESQQVEPLRAEGLLLRRSDEVPECLVWAQSPDYDTARISRPMVKLDLTYLGAPAGGRPPISLLARIIRNQSDPDTQAWLARAAMAWRQDAYAVQSDGMGRGMNWAAIEAGTRIDGGRSTALKRYGQHGARMRLTAIEQNLSDWDQRLLHVMILKGYSRHAAAESIGCPPKQIEHDAARALKRLAELYDTAVKRPGQATRSDEFGST